MGALGMILGAAAPLIAKKIESLGRKPAPAQKLAPAPANYAAAPVSSERSLVMEEPVTVSRTVVKQDTVQQSYRDPYTGQWVEYVPSRPQQVVFTETVQQASHPIGAVRSAQIAVAAVGAPVTVYGATQEFGGPAPVANYSISREIDTTVYDQGPVDVYNQTNVYNVTEYDTSYQVGHQDMLWTSAGSG